MKTLCYSQYLFELLNFIFLEDEKAKFPTANTYLG